MRTRRSWRNQERLWKALGGQAPAAIKAAPRIYTEAEIDALPGLSKSSRALMKREMRNALIRRLSE